MKEKLEALRQRYITLGNDLQSPDLTPKKMAEYAKEYSDLTPIIEKIERLQKIERDVAGAEGRFVVAFETLHARDRVIVVHLGVDVDPFIYSIRE